MIMRYYVSILRSALFLARGEYSWQRRISIIFCNHRRSPRDRYLGQGKLEKARSMGRRVASVTLACSGVLGTTLLLLSGVIPRCFTSDPAVLERLGKLLPLLAVQQPLIAMTLVTEGLLVGAGQVRTRRFRQSV